MYRYETARTLIEFANFAKCERNIVILCTSFFSKLCVDLYALRILILATLSAMEFPYELSCRGKGLSWVNTEATCAFVFMRYR